MMSEAAWRRLLDQIRDGRVVPVIGPELLVYDITGNQSLQARVAEKLLALYNQPLPPEGLPAFRELNDAVVRLRQARDDNGPVVRNLQDLYADVHGVLRELTGARDNVLPSAIDQLARIADFRLFVTLTPDTLLASALKRRCAVNEIVHSPDLSSSESRDLPADWRDRPNEVQLLYLFGKVSSTPVYALTEEDVLEYAHSMIAGRGHVLPRFFGELQELNLMLLGCNFPDWLSRLFLRLTNKERLSSAKAKREWLVEELQDEPGLVTFLRNYSHDTEILADVPPLEFVAELLRRWQADNEARQQAGPAGSGGDGDDERPLPPPGAIFFVSYSRGTDQPYAEALVEALRQLGVAERELWFDRQTIEPGDDFRNKILDGIAGCRYFLPVLSEATNAREEGFVFREWQAANDRLPQLNRDFIYPIIVDADYAPERYTARPVRAWQSLDFGHAPAGAPDARTMAKLTKLLRDARRHEV